MPQDVIGIAIPFMSEGDALAFVVTARESPRVHPRCLEYFDTLAFDIARSKDDQPGWAESATAMVYVEQEIGAVTTDDALDIILEAWLDLAELHRAHSDLRVFQGESQLRHARQMRHAVPATMNERGAACRSAGGRKVSTDWAVPYHRLAEAIAMARALADSQNVAQAVVYGHAGNGHPHQNYIAHDAGELRTIESVIERTLRNVIAMGGTVAAEHGIGKLKRRWLPLQMNPLQIRVMQAVKRELDPEGILGQGNVLESTNIL
jgi:FAD/FMN-containing dehydrogenase